MEVQRENPKALEVFKLRLKELESKIGKVGWFSTSKYPDTGESVAYVAAIQELGSPERSIPPRPFMRPAVIENKNKWERIAADGANNILAGKTTSQEVMETLTFVAENDVRKNIATLTEPALSPLTLAIRKYKKLNPGIKITGGLVGEIAGKLKNGEIDTSGVSTKPLVDSRVMISELSSVVENANS